MSTTSRATSTEPQASQRLDIWLWASRFYKSRKLATEAIKGGHISVNGKRAKPSRQVHVNDRLRIRRFPQEFTVFVTALSLKRLSASLAADLYEETEQSLADRQKKQQLARDQRAGLQYDRRKPGRRDRQKMLNVKNQQPDWIDPDA